MRGAHFVGGGVGDVASMSLLENWVDEAERRVWFLFECARKGQAAGAHPL
jgi:starvation-inducible DNA-binding protein